MKIFNRSQPNMNPYLFKVIKTLSLILITLCISYSLGVSNEHESKSNNSTQTEHGNESKKSFDVSELLFHHVLESHDWHILDIPAAEDGHYTPISIPLPWIVYSSEKGLDFFMLSGHGHHELDESAKQKGYTIVHKGKSEKIKLLSDPENGFIIDFSPSKTVIQMLIIGLIMVLVFRSVAKGYAENRGAAPKGVQSLFEPIIVFIRDEVAKPNLHGKHDRFMPYLLTLFFFIWFSNIFGMLPINSNIMGNISITFTLALLTLIITNFNGTASYWGHIFWFPNVPLPVKLLMIPVELVGIVSKPFALMVRLFANIAAGHFMILALISLIFLLGKGGQSVGGALGIMPLSFAFTLFIMTLEVLVGIIQAYVFTLLTCVFVGMALESHDHSHEHEAHAH